MRRLQKLCAGHDLDGAPDDLILISDAAATLADLRAWDAVAYLVDSLSEAAGIELNDNTLYSAWWRERIKPILDLGCMVVFTHLRGHRKPGIAADRDSASRGATQIRALSTAVLELRQLTDTTFGVRHNKHRNTTALPFGVLELQGAIDDPSIRLALTAATPATAESKARRARGLLTAMGAASGGAWLTRRTIETTLNPPGKPKAERVSERTWGPVLGEMTAEHLFEAGKEGRADAWRWIGPVPTETDDDD